MLDLSMEIDPRATGQTPSDPAGIVIAATFTAEPLAESLKFWVQNLNLPVQIEFAPYNHVMQCLLDPGGPFARNKGGMNVVLLRFEDWKRFPKGENKSWGDEVRELVAALETAAGRIPSPILVCICPASPQTFSVGQETRSINKAEKDLVAALARSSMIRCVPSSELLRLYPVLDYCDPDADKFGHIPYTPEMFAALGTIIVRNFQSSRQVPFKAIVLDCDNTLWAGLCAENGADGIDIDAPHRALQDFMKVQKNQGVLLNLCSKNNLEDVEAVFDNNQAMVLRRDDIAAWRVNWQAKSENIRSLAEELQLGLDSFVFIDDNPAEIAEVRANCPGVLTLTLPARPDQIPRFLDHVWAFDLFAVTAEDTRRAATYQENQLRKKLQTESLSYADFLAGLALEIHIRELKHGEEARAAQLTQRTNQFNMVTRRCTEPEIKEMIRTGSARILTAFVRDRLGDYGQVGLIMYGVSGGRILVQNLMLSCRVLGKGVEYALLAHLGQIAKADSLSHVEVLYMPTTKNLPARNFLTSFPLQYREDLEQGFICRFPADFAAAMRFSPEEWEPPKADSGAPSAKPRITFEASRDQASFEWIATNFYDARLILEAAQVSATAAAPRPTSFEPPRSELERKIVSIWKRVLAISPIGIHDNYFDLGGDSVQAVRIFVEIKKITGATLPLVTLFESPTVAQLTQLLGDRNWKPHWRSLVPIKTSGARPPFYCVHGVGGNVIEYMDIARYLHQDQPLYGIQAIGLDGKSYRDNPTVEQMAAHYIREIREFQPSGPYYVGGSSFGGLVAYEMARQLHAEGQEIAIVALFDTYGPGYPKLLPTTTVWEQRLNKLRYRTKLHWSNFLATEPVKRPQYVWLKAKRAERAILSKSKLTIGTANQAVRHFLERLFWPDAIRHVAEAGHWAAGGYIPGEYAGTITLFRATEQPLGIYVDRTSGWGSVVKGEIETYDTPGHHGSIVREPRARFLVRQLEDALHKAQLRRSK